MSEQNRTDIEYYLRTIKISRHSRRRKEETYKVLRRNIIDNGIQYIDYSVYSRVYDRFTFEFDVEESSDLSAYNYSFDIKDIKQFLHFLDQFEMGNITLEQLLHLAGMEKLGDSGEELF